MAIFNSYVKLPEGKMNRTWGPAKDNIESWEHPDEEPWWKILLGVSNNGV